MLRIRFTAGDLARTRLATEPRPLGEIMASLRLLQYGGDGVGFGGWRRRVLRELGDERVRSRVAPLFHLVDPHAYSPDFLVPLDGDATLDGELDEVLATPQNRLRRELTTLADSRGRQPAWLRTLADTGGDSLGRLGSALCAYHDVALAPYWPQVASHVGADRARHCRALAAGGVEEMFAQLHPAIVWRPPVLEVACPWEYDLALRGGGLLIVPTFFRGSAVHRRPRAADRPVHPGGGSGDDLARAHRERVAGGATLGPGAGGPPRRHACRCARCGGRHAYEHRARSSPRARAGNGQLASLRPARRRVDHDPPQPVRRARPHSARDGAARGSTTRHRRISSQVELLAGVTDAEVRCGDDGADPPAPCPRSRDERS